MQNVKGVPRETKRKSQLDPAARYCRPGQVEPMFGLGRTLLYQYAKRGWVRLIHLRPPGTKRGVTLVDLDSVRALIARHDKPLTLVKEGGAK